MPFPTLARRSTSVALAAAMAGSLFAFSPVAVVPAYSAGGDRDSTITPSCRKGKVWDRRTKKCVKAKKSSGLSDDNLYAAARDLAYHRRYDEAINVLRLAENQNDPRILNYLGYSHRKLGDVETGLNYYRTALKFDPDYTLVREYMGEAFLQLGQVDKAREQLAEIEKRCGADCREYAMLQEQIDAHTAKQGQ
ncbi:MAG: tetratricopeptide repeat protein [Ahrensia sp.]|nr:tetratricopeptide repeat protein [Ahrensia sp.]